MPFIRNTLNTLIVQQKIYNANPSVKKNTVAILISNKVDFKRELPEIKSLSFYNDKG